MPFNSNIFLIFFPVVYVLYLASRRRHGVQNGLLLVSSYVFYGYWNWRFLSLIIISTLVDFLVGRRLAREERLRQRKLWLTCSIVVNLSILGFFKYFNFFSESFAQLLALAGMQADELTLRIILPVGISFYTFQTMSYTIDVYRRRMERTNNFLDFAVFVAFFPQLVAGPIERAARLLPQIASARRIDARAVDAGLFLILWGYFKKVVIADRMALIANRIFNHHPDYAGLDMVIAVIAFAFQIYGDFSGYSDIARGLARLMGIELMVNFKLPYFARNPSDFWQRWHVSLSSWLRDYLYIPLGGNRGGSYRTYRNLTLTMLLGGLWHGASWNFVLWGAFHGLLLVTYRLGKRVTGLRASTHGVGATMQIGVMFILTLIGWLLFRSESAGQAWAMFSRISLTRSPASSGFVLDIVLFVTPLLIIQLYQHARRDLLAPASLPQGVRIPLYGLLLAGIVGLGVRESIEFIYFQF